MPAHVGDRLADTAETFQNNGIVHFDLENGFGGVDHGNHPVCQSDYGDQRDHAS